MKKDYINMVYHKELDLWYPEGGEPLPQSPYVPQQTLYTAQGKREEGPKEKGTLLDCIA